MDYNWVYKYMLEKSKEKNWIPLRRESLKDEYDYIFLYADGSLGCSDKYYKKISWCLTKGLKFTLSYLKLNSIIIEQGTFS